MLDPSKQPFALRHPIAIHLIGILTAVVGLLLQGLGIVDQAFVVSGVVIGCIGIMYSLAAKRCGQIASHANDQAKGTALKSAENSQAVMNAQNLMHQAMADRKHELFTKLKRTSEDCENRKIELKEIEKDIGEMKETFNHHESELSELSNAFVIMGMVITSLGAFVI